MKENLLEWSVNSGQWSVLFLMLLFLFTVYCSLFTFVKPAHAQLEIADTYDLADKSAVGGDIISLTTGGLVRTASEYDSKMYGVINDDPLAVYKRIDGTGLAVSRNGIVSVNVTTANGEIKIGDYITGSVIPGKGQKAILSGYVVGVALAGFKEGDGQQIDYTPFKGAASKKVSSGSIPVSIQIQYAEISTARNTNVLLERLNAALFTNVQDPEKFLNVIRYIASGLVAIFSVLVGLLILARVVPKGVEGMGRNPLARQSILIYTAFNILIVIVIIFLGIGAALLLLRL